MTSKTLKRWFLEALFLLSFSHMLVYGFQFCFAVLRSVSPLAPVLANLFMGHHEKIWLEQYQGSELLFYRRYVDDTF